MEEIQFLVTVTQTLCLVHCLHSCFTEKLLKVPSKKQLDTSNDLNSLKLKHLKGFTETFENIIKLEHKVPE